MNNPLHPDRWLHRAIVLLAVAILLICLFMLRSAWAGGMLCVGCGMGAGGSAGNDPDLQYAITTQSGDPITTQNGSIIVTQGAP